MKHWSRWNQLKGVAEEDAKPTEKLRLPLAKRIFNSLGQNQELVDSFYKIVDSYKKGQIGLDILIEKMDIFGLIHLMDDLLNSLEKGLFVSEPSVEKALLGSQKNKAVLSEPVTNVVKNEKKKQLKDHNFVSGSTSGQSVERALLGSQKNKAVLSEPVTNRVKFLLKNEKKSRIKQSNLACFEKQCDDNSTSGQFGSDERALLGSQKNLIWEEMINNEKKKQCFAELKVKKSRIKQTNLEKDVITTKKMEAAANKYKAVLINAEIKKIEKELSDSRRVETDGESSIRRGKEEALKLLKKNFSEK